MHQMAGRRWQQMADSGTREKNLTPKQHAAIAALMTAADVAAAAKSAGVGERTLRRWLAEDPAFIAALTDAQRQTLEAVIRRLTTLANAATGVLAKVMADDRATAASKVRAADIVLDRLLQLRQQLDLEQRLAAIEQALQVTSGKH